MVVGKRNKLLGRTRLGSRAYIPPSQNINDVAKFSRLPKNCCSFLLKFLMPRITSTEKQRKQKKASKCIYCLSVVSATQKKIHFFTSDGINTSFRWQINHTCLDGFCWTVELGSQLKFFTKDVELRRLLLEFPVQNIYSRMEKRFVAKSMNTLGTSLCQNRKIRFCMFCCQVNLSWILNKYAFV